MKRFAGLLFVFSVLVCSPAQATPIIAAASGLAAPIQTVTFNEVVLGNGTQLFNQYSGLGVTFNNLWYNTQPIVSGNIQSPVAENFTITNFVFNPFSVFFNAPVTAAALVAGTNAGITTRFTALLNNVVVETFDSPTNLLGVNDWFGFQGIVFNELRIQALPSANNGAVVIDNLQIGAGAVTAVPEPATLFLLSVGLYGLTLFRKRR